MKNESRQEIFFKAFGPVFGPKMDQVEEAVNSGLIDPTQALVLQVFIASERAMSEGETFESLLSAYKTSNAKRKQNGY